MDEYGPQTEEIKAFVERVRNLTSEQAEELESAWWNVRHFTWMVARNTAWDAAWIAVPNAVWENTLEAVVKGASMIVIRSFAWNVVADALLAIMAKDEIPERDFNTLYGPWKSVMEE